VIRFGVLGPLDVRVEGREADLGGPRQRSLLVALLVHAGEPISADALAQMLWGDEAPPSAPKALQVTVWRLRGALGVASDRIETVAGGYRLRLEPGELDAERFDRAYERARTLAPRSAAAALREALALWRGPALADVRYEPWAQGEIRRLEELRGAAIEARVEADLALGEHARLVGELEALVAEHPLRERLRAQQMLALYRSGRHADALAAFRAARETLDAELGLEAGPELRALEQQILTHDPALRAAATGVPPPPPTPTFGRDRDVQAVLAILESARLLTLTGPGGVGKTRLAIEIVRQAGGRFVPLAAIVDAGRIPDAACDALGIRRMPGEAAIEVLARALGGGALLVLDNLEHLPGAAAVVARLLESAPSATVLATSRQPLHLSAERVYAVAPLGVDDAVAMFADRAGARAAPADDDVDAVTDICTRVGGLPLAIELAAGRLGVLTPRDLAARLSDALGLLSRGPEDAPDRHRTLRATLDWSSELLGEPERAAFTALAAFAGGCELAAAEEVTEAPLAVLEDLVDKSLVTAQAGRLSMLEPVRQYAAERLAARADADAVRERHLAHVMRFAREAEQSLIIWSRSCPAFVRIQRERENLRVAIEFALASGRPVDALTLIGDLGVYCWSAGPDAELRGLARRALAEAASADVWLRARAQFTLTHNTVFGDEQLASAEAALELFRAAGDETWIVRGLIVVSYLTLFRGDYAGGRATAVEALERARALADDELVGTAMAHVAGGTPRAEDAAALVREAAVHLRNTGAHEIASAVLTTVGLGALGNEAYDIATELQYEALDAALIARDPYALAAVHGNLALAALLGGRPDAAAEAFREELLTARACQFGNFYFEGLLGMAALAAARGDDPGAATLEAAATSLLDRPVYEAERPVYDQITERFIVPARERLGPEAWATAAAAGRALSSHDALALALAEPAGDEPLPRRSGSRPSSIPRTAP
jgi:predicted ATPase/DNA-binding SARP family transcriptional activator